MLDRLITHRLDRLRKSVLLLGPRQVGKSTLCRGLGPQHTILLAVEREFLKYAKDPSLLGDELRASRGKGLVFIDEVQRVPALLNEVQALLDQPENQYRFLLTGSSARKLRRGAANLLPGRVILEYLDPLTCFELGEQFDLARALQVGMLPGVFLDRTEGTTTLETYSEVYLREEVQAEALTKNLGGYARFLDIMAVESGRWLNYSKLASDTEMPKETIRRFVSLLEDTLLAFRVPSFRPRQKSTRRVSQRDRILLFDVGVRNALLSLHRRPVTQDQKGFVFEQWFILQTIYLNRALRNDWSISSYRSAGGAEVDLVIERDDDIVAIEIKASRNIAEGAGRGFGSLEETVGRYKPVRKRIASQVDKPRLKGNDILIMPFVEVLEELRG